MNKNSTIILFLRLIIISLFCACNLRTRLNMYSKKEIVDVLSEIDLDFEEKEVDNAVMFIGPTGAGKSTVINYLNKVPLKKMLKKQIETENYFSDSSEDDKQKTYNIESEYKIAIDTEKTTENSKIAKIGNTVFSETSRPNLYYSQDYNLTFCDCPGFYDTRKDLYFRNTVYNNYLIKNIKNVKSIVIVVEYSQFLAVRGKLFVSGVLDVLSNIFTNLNENIVQDSQKNNPFNSIMLLFTKVEKKIKRKDILNKIIEFSNSYKEQKEERFQTYRKLLNKIISYKGENIVIIRPLDNGKTRDSLMKRLLKYDNIDKNKIGFVGSNDVVNNFEALINSWLVYKNKKSENLKNAKTKIKNIEEELEFNLKIKEKLESEIDDLITDFNRIKDRITLLKIELLNYEEDEESYEKEYKRAWMQFRKNEDYLNLARRKYNRFFKEKNLLREEILKLESKKNKNQKRIKKETDEYTPKEIVLNLRKKVQEKNNKLYPYLNKIKIQQKQSKEIEIKIKKTQEEIDMDKKWDDKIIQIFKYIPITQSVKSLLVTKN
ncbi:MAG: hypothetical protein GY830_03220 [Bacteroidetes bacterium]|nr:hypothetical protein [Bacteroidota bacterium]